MRRTKILYAASTVSHLDRFHAPYLDALRKEHDVYLMATEAPGVDFPLPFDKKLFSAANFRSIKKIREILKREAFDKVIVNTSLAAFLVRAATFGIPKKDRPFILNVVHGYLFSYPVKGKRAKLLFYCERFLRKRTDAIAVMNEEDLYIAKKYHLARGRVSFMRGMGITLPPHKLSKDAYVRRAYAHEPEDFLCTFVGELSARKNQLFLIRAAKRLYEQGVPIRLLLIGEGADRELLEEEIKKLCMEDRIYLPGTRENVYDYLAVTDLYVSACVSEGLPFNVMEAMACGLPMLITDTKGQRDLMRGQRECLYALGDADTFCSEVKRIYELGRYGMGTCVYPQLEEYLLASVFEENMKILMKEK